MYQFDRKKAFSYVGEFWYSDTPDKQFPGVLNYTPEKGLFIKFMGPADFTSIVSQNIEDKTIHGLVEQIEHVTLLNCLPSGGSTRLGQMSYSVKEYSVSFAVLGKHCEKKDCLFTGIVFHFPEIDSFYRFNTDMYFVNDKKPLINCKLTNNQHIKIYQGIRDTIDLNYVLPKNMQAKLIPLLKQYDIIVRDKIIDSKSKMTKRDEIIVKKVDKMKSRLLITKPFYCIDIVGRKNTMGDYIRKRQEIMKLFSLFSLRAIYCDFTQLREGKKLYTIIEQPGKHHSKNKLVMPYMPITIHNIKEKFAQIFNRWINLPTKLLNMLFFDKLYQEANVGYQQYSIIIAILGSWQLEYGLDKSNKTRYEKLLEENLLPSDPINDEILVKLKSIFGNGSSLNEIAFSLGEIRDCILHMDSITKTQKKYQKYKAILEDNTQINNLCEVLFIFMVKIVYSYLGIIMSDDQKKMLAMRIITWANYSL